MILFARLRTIQYTARSYRILLFPVRHRRIALDAVGYDVAQVVRLAVADPLRRQVAVDLPLRPVVGEAVAARSARLADAAHDPLFCYIVGVVDASLGLIFLLSVSLYVLIRYCIISVSVSLLSS